MKLVVESKESGSRWELEIDADKQTVLDLLDSNEWVENIESEFLSEDWNRKKGKGFEVFGFEDDEISDVVNEIKSFFEDQGLDVEDVEYVADDNEYVEDTESEEYDEDDEYSEDDEEEEEDLYDDYYPEKDEDEEY